VPRMTATFPLAAAAAIDDQARSRKSASGGAAGLVGAR